MSSPRATRALLLLLLGLICLVGCTSGQPPGAAPRTGPTASAPSAAAARPQAKLRPPVGDIGDEFTLLVDGASCPSGAGLTVVWDTLGPIARIDRVIEPGTTYLTVIAAPKDAYGSHPVGIRCGDDEAELASTRYQLTNAPTVTVYPSSALPGDDVIISVSGFSCANDVNFPARVHASIAGTGRDDHAPTIPGDIKPGRHQVFASCIWPVRNPPQVTGAFWVPGITRLSPDGGSGGTAVLITGAGFDCARVDIDLEGTPLGTAEVPPDRARTGAFSTRVTIPADTRRGRYLIGASCPGAVRPTVPFIVDNTFVPPSYAAAQDDRNARSERNVRVALGAGALLLLVLTVAALLARRAARRRSRRPGLEIRPDLGEPRVQGREAEERP
ncbi:hypothetical protein F4553_005845 [Allocatelliglobosispora scoriae]|uniref:IPT/TIG domain-containing protein n=1 Tax=Allocatelliglobosispora scoriae TaxID=643052 RepID=A0A841C0K1_9ACTN|nr:hypothetical protein [Allocatelliglobosispora scoriae]MBB5872411.1 hypothetical protein [Allocatelliglobosispora scoriae]